MRTSNPPPARLLPVVLFTTSYLLIATAAAMMRGNKEFLFYIITMLVLVTVVWVIHRRIALYPAQLWALAIWGLVHMAGGLIPVPEAWAIDGEQRVLYSWWLIPHYLKYDQIVHAYGFAVTTWLCWHGIRSQFLQRSQEAVVPTLGLLVIAAAAGMGFGALNEVIEFIAVLTIPDTNVGGYENTGWDLVANMVGAMIAAVLIRRRVLP